MSIKLLGAFHCISELLSASIKNAQELFNATCNYLNGTSNEWYFFTDRDPLPASHYRITKQATLNNIQWTYNRYQNTLVQNCSGLQPVAVRCDWLSAELHVGRRIYSLDDWVRSLYIVVENYELLSIEVLVNAWSIYERIWPDTYELHIVDSDGESHVFHRDALLDEEWQSLLPHVQEQPEPYIGEEEEEEEEEEEGEEEGEEEEPEADAEDEQDVTEETTESTEPIAEPVTEPVTEPVVMPTEPLVTPVDDVTPTESIVAPLPPSPTQEVEVM